MITETELRIDWAELDLFGHVNNVAFFRYIQAARLEFCERAGLGTLNEPGTLSFMVAASQCNFMRPLFYPGTVRVRVSCAWTKNTSFQLSYELFDKTDNKVAEAADVLVLYDYQQQAKAIIQPGLKKKLMET